MYTIPQVRSLGSRSDLFLMEYQAEVEPRDGYLLVKTPDNPGYFWGNYLFFPHAPGPGDRERWEALFRHEFRLLPDVRHVTFGWDGQEKGAHAPFEAAGYNFESTQVLTLEAAALRAHEKMHPGLEVRPLASDADWEAMFENQVACRGDGFRLETYVPYKRRQVASYRRLLDEGKGAWYGAFLDGRLVADCGLFHFGDLARFQSVGTAPGLRRQGVCARLIHEVCRAGLARNPRATLVMAAAAGEPAERVYRSVGFQPFEMQYGLCRWPRELWLK